jgi:hypothetical protein
MFKSSSFIKKKRNVKKNSLEYILSDSIKLVFKINEPPYYSRLYFYLNNENITDCGISPNLTDSILKIENSLFMTNRTFLLKLKNNKVNKNFLMKIDYYCVNFDLITFNFDLNFIFDVQFSDFQNL